MNPDLYPFVRIALITALVVLFVGLAIRQRQNRDHPANPEGVALAAVAAGVLFANVEAQIEGVASGFRVLVLLLLVTAANCAVYVPIVHHRKQSRRTQ